jgi:hypothetical protein
MRLLTALALVLVATRDALPQATAAPMPAATAVFRLDPYIGTARTLQARVGGLEGRFLFDTGEGITVVTQRFAAAIPCKPWGRITGFRMTGARVDMQRCDDLAFDLGPVVLPAATTGVFDIMTVLPAHLPRLDGSIALDLFDGRAITLRLAAGELILESRASLEVRTAAAREIPIRLGRDAEGSALAVDVAVPTSAGTAWMELDSGNGGTLVVARHIAPLLHLDPLAKKTQRARFTIAGDIAVVGDARTPDGMIMDGNIGARFLENWDLTLDLSGKGRAWLAPAKKHEVGKHALE